MAEKIYRAVVIALLLAILTVLLNLRQTAKPPPKDSARFQAVVKQGNGILPSAAFVLDTQTGRTYDPTGRPLNPTDLTLPQYSCEKFAQKYKAANPQFANVPDQELVQRLVRENPKYKNRIVGPCKNSQ